MEERASGYEVRLVLRNGEMISLNTYTSKSSANQVIELLKPLVRNARRKGRRP